MGRSVSIVLKDTVKTKINNTQIIQLESGETSENKYPAVIAGNTVNILPIRFSDTNYVTVNTFCLILWWKLVEQLTLI